MAVHRRAWILGAALTMVILAQSLRAQEDLPPAGRGGAQGGRGGGGRGGRSGGRGGTTREFLGLGPAPDEAAAKKGEPLYKQNCGTCHGDNARGAQGPNLVRSVTVLHDEKGEEIGPVVKNGRPQAGMPGFPTLSQDDVYNIGQYIHLQVELAANRGTYGSTYAGMRNQSSGDARKGEDFFNASCKSCHSATGDLAKIDHVQFEMIETLRAADAHDGGGDGMRGGNGHAKKCGGGQHGSGGGFGGETVDGMEPDHFVSEGLDDAPTADGGAGAHGQSAEHFDPRGDRQRLPSRRFSRAQE